MEKLEPVLKQKFWILLGVAILMTFIGWWMATSEMSAAIITRTDLIKKSFEAVPSGAIPNESWANKLRAVNAEQDRTNKATQIAMWKRQLAKQTWPKGVDPINGYWGKFPNDMRDQFRDMYPIEMVQVWKMLNPMDEEAGTGVVRYPLRDMFNLIGKGPWENAPPDADTMWEIQEDLWLLEGLFQTIASLNGGPEAGRADAIIHEIDKLQLRGGGEKVSGGSGGAGGYAAVVGASQGAGGFGGGAGGLGGGVQSMPTGASNAGPMGAMGGAGGSLGSGLTVVSAEFDPAEELGDDGSSSAGGMSSTGSFGSMGSSMMGADSSGGLGGGGVTAAKAINRYVIPKDQSKPRETGPFRTRGFYLSVKMDHTKIPLLIEELSANDKSVWPIEILRVQMSRINEDSDGSFGGMSGSSGARRMGYAPGLSDIPSHSLQSAAAARGMSMSGAFNPMGGVGGLGEDRLTLFGIKSPSADAATSQQALTARAAFENALKDPVMAQVTLCGVFTLYNKVDDLPEPAAAPAAVPRAEETAPVESNSTDADGKTTAPIDTPPAESPAAESPASTDVPADKADSPAPKADATTESATESKPEPKPDSNEK